MPDVDDDDLAGTPEIVPPPPPFRKGDVVRSGQSLGVVVGIVWNEYTWDLHCVAEDGIGVCSPDSVTLANDDPEAVAEAARLLLRRQQEWEADPQSKWVK